MILICNASSGLLSKQSLPKNFSHKHRDNQGYLHQVDEAKDDLHRLRQHFQHWYLQSNDGGDGSNVRHAISFPNGRRLLRECK
jgi:hypothetical protein